MTRGWSGFVLLGLLALASWQVASAGYIWAKARLAQYLIADAWQQMLQTGEPVRPWRWADTWPVARLKIKGQSLYVLQGASGRVLAFAPGHVDGTSEPGHSGTIAIAGHRDTHFALLEQVQAGDRVTLHSRLGIQHFAISEGRVVSAGDSQVLAPTGDTRLLLITCYPFDGLAGQASERYVLIAHLVEPS